MGLESVAADLAATNATPADLVELERLLAESADLVKHGSAFTDSAGEFHAAVARASHNWAIQMSLRAIREVLHELHVRNTTAARARRVVQTHRAIYAAIKAGDGSQAGQLMRAHIDATRVSADRIEHAAAPDFVDTPT